ncbi:unnamed protein product [Arctia plantaginis]|uniref:Uncharacterized protein n=1 Tax=Arctia plantaginis TaxID=874455 RepID=A0A8S1BS76_ARCPL|nr:unnamed protein product [Arctia plantaginis]
MLLRSSKLRIEDYANLTVRPRLQSVTGAASPPARRQAASQHLHNNARCSAGYLMKIATLATHNKPEYQIA